MVVFNYILLIVIALALFVLSIAFVLLITRNVRQGLVVRQQLARRVETLRMSKMLRALGLDFSAYLHTMPISKISDSMSKCENCDTLGQCDEQLKQEEIKPEDIDFCPNQDCLSKFSELQDKETSSS